MCYHIAFTVKLESILDYFPDLIVDDQLDIDFPVSNYMNGFNHEMTPVMVLGRKDGKKHLARMMWGFLPAYIKNMEDAQRFWTGYKDEKGKWINGFTTLNAVGEEMFSKPMYKEAALTKRCIVFTDGFYEWRHVYPLNKKTGLPLKTALKYPYHIKLKGESLIMMAGLWTPWRHQEVNKDTGEITDLVTPVYTIVTTVANALMAQVHNSKMRMPTILTKELAEEWLDPNLRPERILEIATHQYPVEKMEAYTVEKGFQEAMNPRLRHEYPDLAPVVC